MWQGRRPPTPSAEEIQRAARAVVKVLAEHGFQCCLIGSTAAAMYGAENRNPRDVDFVILPSPSQTNPETNSIDIEELKHLITENNSSDFYLTPSLNPTATYQILHYILTPQFPTPSLPLHRECKVDLLLPANIGLPPYIPPEKIHYEEYFPDIPLAPFLLLLLAKVRAWAEHRIDERRRMNERVKYDESDIRELLDLGVNEYMCRLGELESWAGENWVMDVTREYVRPVVERFPRTGRMWEEMGFVVKSEWSLPPV
ncbi:hypothetical protein P691DRAFT_804760 [Macrolepiota fuliginosa MF-IS2]|uniref:Nucleotidyltransferase n=1 Tax=Macrolepiota fuliginosa MF-IS2 TaxID=1400762 RepID=A0A9P5X8I4_9AGAR|nr:hypothetical protein P691DRAFT_804760 [Macrolepiota fuliginosa MF-IS2]